MSLESSSTYRWVKDQGRLEGQAEGRVEGRLEGRAEGHLEGRSEEARDIILRQGSAKFGTPDSGIRAALNEVTDIECLEALTVRLLQVSSWQELLDKYVKP